MESNTERILEEESNKPKEEALSEEMREETMLAGRFGPRIEGGKDVQKKFDKELADKMDLLMGIDQEQALALNDEFDRLVGNLEGKEGEELQKAEAELEEFKVRLNAKLKAK